jgi:hypothetical protein
MGRNKRRKTAPGAQASLEEMAEVLFGSRPEEQHKPQKEKLCMGCTQLAVVQVVGSAGWRGRYCVRCSLEVIEKFLFQVCGSMRASITVRPL